MSLSSSNNVVIADVCCPSVYRMCNKVASCAEFLQIKTSAHETEVTIRLIDKFNRVYYHVIETDAQGYAVIDLSELPSALLNEYAGKFTVSVYENATLVQFSDSSGSKYDAIEFECAKFTPTPTNTYIDISL